MKQMYSVLKMSRSRNSFLLDQTHDVGGSPVFRNKKTLPGTNVHNAPEMEM